MAIGCTTDLEGCIRLKASRKKSEQALEKKTRMLSCYDHDEEGLEFYNLSKHVRFGCLGKLQLRKYESHD